MKLVWNNALKFITTFLSSLHVHLILNVLSKTFNYTFSWIPQLSREQKVVFDEIPGVIKVGYKPIDDHCSESTLGEGGAEINQFRREKLKEYFEVKKLCEESGLPFTPKALDRGILEWLYFISR